MVDCRGDVERNKNGQHSEPLKKITSIDTQLVNRQTLALLNWVAIIICVTSIASAIILLIPALIVCVCVCVCVRACVYMCIFGICRACVYVRGSVSLSFLYMGIDLFVTIHQGMAGMHAIRGSAMKCIVCLLNMGWSQEKVGEVSV